MKMSLLCYLKRFKNYEDEKKGQEAHVTIDSIPGEKFPAQIIWVGDSVSPQTRTLPIRANVTNKNLLLKPGMFARMKVDVGMTKKLVVPSQAVIQEGDDNFVFVNKGKGNFEERKITQGVDDGNYAEIVSGLTLGEVVVCHGGTSLLGDALKSAEEN